MFFQWRPGHLGTLNFPRKRSVYVMLETLLKEALLRGCFSRFLNCTNRTKSRWPSHVKFSKAIVWRHPTSLEVAADQATQI